MNYIKPTLALLALVLITGPSCVNSRLPSQVSKNLTGGAGSNTSNSTSDSHVIGNVLISTPASATSTTSSTYVATIYFDPSKSKAASGSTPPMISSHCTQSNTSGGNSKPCVCQFSWSENNTTSGSNRPFNRTVQTSLTKVQQQLVECKAPDSYESEIPNGTSIKVTVMATSGNAEVFSVNTFNYLKNTLATIGSFQDAQGHAFDNIVHYSCYEQFKVGTAIRSRVDSKQNSTTGEATSYPFSNRFCLQTSGSGSTSDCPNMPTLGNSAQAYYYNFFTRASQAGLVNQWNNRYTCPSIKEPIYGQAGVGTQSRLYPMDSSFALSMGPTPEFNVGVDSFVELADGNNDPVSKGAQMCNGQTGPANGSTDGFVLACAGYAAKPAADGTCPYIRDSSGVIRFTYRLRRFIALYPPLFGIDGKAPTQPQRTDTIYVLDRPVTPPAGADPLKPYTMRGPKPCPFAMFDSQGVLGYPDALYTKTGGKLPVYGATNNVAWNGTNVDGAQLPNTDSSNSCAATIPLVHTDALNPDLTVISLGTVNQYNPALPRAYIRPTRAWAPHYEEDTSFQACAPQASTMHDPPLHFAKDPTTGNVSWCAEVYPSQNDHVASLDQTANPSAAPSAANPFIGHVRPYTSHVSKNSGSADCVATVPSTIPTGTTYPAVSGGSCPALITGVAALSPSALARHPADAYVDKKNTAINASDSQTPVCATKTCDRTAIITGGIGWQQFPLLATAGQVESAISQDTTYGCVMTYDGGGTKAGKLSPTNGCCGANVKLATGVTVGASYTTKPHAVNTTAHLEPDSACLIPTY